MKHRRKIGHLAFDLEFFDAVTEAGSLIRFTKSERRLLRHFSNNPNVAFERDALLDVVGGEDSATSDRNIDHLVSRLRKKLDDTGPQKTYLISHYGVGYEWIAKAPVKKRTFKPVTIGKVTGLNHCKTQLDVAEAFLQAMKNEIGLAFATNSKAKSPNVADLASVRPIDAPAGSFHLDLAFLQRDSGLSVAVSIRRTHDGDTRLVGVSHLSASPVASEQIQKSRPN